MIQIKRYFLFLILILLLSFSISVGNTQTNQERVDYLLDQLQNPLDEESQQEIKGAIIRIWQLAKSVEIQEKINQIGIFIRLKQYQEAEDFLTEIIMEQDDFLDAYYKRAIIHYYQAEIVKAEADLYKVLAIEPRHFDALKVLGLILEKQNKNVEAYNVYTELHKILPYDESVIKKLEKLNQAI